MDCGERSLDEEWQFRRPWPTLRSPVKGALRLLPFQPDVLTPVLAFFEDQWFEREQEQQRAQRKHGGGDRALMPPHTVPFANLGCACWIRSPRARVGRRSFSTAVEATSQTFLQVADRALPRGIGGLRLETLELALEYVRECNSILLLGHDVTPLGFLKIRVEVSGIGLMDCQILYGVLFQVEL